jgi:ABC-type Na+ efflux pump permease subunit
MNYRKVGWLVRKDLKEALGNKFVVLPMFILPLVLCVAIPVLLVYLGLELGAIASSGAQSLERLLPLYDIPGRLVDPVERMLYVFLNYTMMPFFIIIPIMLSGVIAANSVAGEKERKSLETLLYTPLSNREFVLGKLLSSFVPSMAVSLVSFLAYFAVSNGAWYALRGSFVLEAVSWIPALLVLSPAASLMALGATLLVSIKAKTFLEAQQSSALVVLPCIVFVAAQLGGLVVISPLAILAAGAVVLALDYVLIMRVAPRFDRERLISTI